MSRDADTRLLHELIRSDAPYAMLRDEGFSSTEISAARAFVARADSQQHERPARTSTLGQAAHSVPGFAVTEGVT